MAPDEHEIRIQKTCLAGVQAMGARSARTFGRHSHDQFGIGLVCAGAQESASGRGLVKARAGELISVNPNEVHDGRAIGGQLRTWRMLYFDPNMLASYICDVTNGSAGSAEFAYPVTTRSLLSIAFHRLFTLLIGPESDFDSLTAETDLLTLVSGLLDGVDRTEAAYFTPSVSLAIDRIDDAPEMAIRLQDLAELAGLSRFHFLRQFKIATGLPPHAYRLQRQIQQARRLLAKGTSPSMAALAAGFSDQSHLTRHFVRAFGVGPGTYARAIA